MTVHAVQNEKRYTDLEESHNIAYTYQIDQQLSCSESGIKIRFTYFKEKCNLHAIIRVRKGGWVL